MMAAERNGARQRNASDAVQPPAPRAVPGAVSAAPGAIPPPSPILPNLAVPVVVPPPGPHPARLVAPPAGLALANLAGALVPAGGRFDVPAALLGPPPKRSNMSFNIWP